MSEILSEIIEEEVTTLTPPQSVDDLKKKMKLQGKVVRLELYGAFIDIGLDVNALIHISQLGENRVNRVSDVINEGDEVTVWIDKIDLDRNQVMVTMIEPLAVEWHELKKGQVYTGKVSRMEDFGVFIDIGAEREGLVHISELSHDYVKHPSEVVKLDDEVKVEVLNFSKRKRRIDLSIKALEEKPEQEEEEPMSIDSRYTAPTTKSSPKRPRKSETKTVVEPIMFEEEDDMPTAMEIALRQAMGSEQDDGSKRSRKKRDRKRDRREKMRAQQEAIMNRTLEMQSEPS